MKSTLYSILLLVAVIFSSTAKAQNNTPLLFAPELGKKYTLNTEVSATFVQEAIDSEKVTNKAGNVMVSLSFLPKNINQNGNYEIECQFIKYVFKSFKNGVTKNAFDSDVIDSNESPTNKKIVAVFKETPFNVEISNTGQLIAINGLDTYYKKLNDDNSEPVDSLELAMMEQKKQQIQIIIKLAFNHFTSFYTSKTINVGDVWTVAADMSIMKVMHWPELKMEDSYTMIGNSGGVITLSGTANYNLNLKGEGNNVQIAKESVIKLNSTTGIVEESKFVYASTEPLTEEEKKTKKPEVVTVTVLVSIVPAN